LRDNVQRHNGPDTAGQVLSLAGLQASGTGQRSSRGRIYNGSPCALHTGSYEPLGRPKSCPQAYVESSLEDSASRDDRQKDEVDKTVGETRDQDNGSNTGLVRRIIPEAVPRRRPSRRTGRARVHELCIHVAPVPICTSEEEKYFHTCSSNFSANRVRALFRICGRSRPGRASHQLSG
jgi:hypothetical protein